MMDPVRYGILQCFQCRLPFFYTNAFFLAVMADHFLLLFYNDMSLKTHVLTCVCVYVHFIIIGKYMKLKLKYLISE